MSAKAMKPSEYLGQQDNLQKFVEYILHVGLPDCREFALSICKPEVDSDGEFIASYTNALAQGGLSFAQLCLRQACNEIMEAIAGAIRNHLEHNGIPAVLACRRTVSQRVADAREIVAALTDMALYLVPGERVTLSAINQILFGADNTLSGPLGHVFADAMRSIMHKADSIALEIVQNHKDRKEAGV